MTLRVPVIVGHQPAKFGGHRHCSCRGKTFLVVEEQDSTCSLKSITVYLYSTTKFHNGDHATLLSPILVIHNMSNNGKKNKKTSFADPLRIAVEKKKK